MKKFFAILFLIPISSIAQNEISYEDIKLPEIDGKVTYQEVIEVPKTNSDELYQRAKLWFVNEFKTSEHVIELDSRTDGIIAGNGITSLIIQSLGYSIETVVDFSIKIEIKESRYRYTISNFLLTNSVNNKIPIETFFSEEWMFKKNGKIRNASLKWFEAFNLEILEMEESIKETMRKSASSDW